MQKNLGQHFLTSHDIARTAIDALGPKSGDVVVEIGPGSGILTKILLEKGASVVAIEKDAALVRELERTFAQDIASGKLEMIEDDIRDFNLPRYKLGAISYKLIGNIPYYITGTILRLSLSANPQPRRAVFMVQKEVADRILARDGKESILSISVKAYGSPRYVRTVKRGSFNPPPRVTSALITIEDISRNFFTGIDEAAFFACVRKGFAHKRKLLKKNLGVEANTLVSCGIQPDARAEDLTLSQWRCLAQSL